MPFRIRMAVLIITRSHSRILASLAKHSEHRTAQESTTKEASSNRQTSTASVSVAIWPTIRSSRPDDPYVRVLVHAPSAVGIVTVCALRSIRTSGRLDVEVAALSVFAKQLRLPGFHGAEECFSHPEMVLVGL
jgi:hypothetical protein